MLRRMQKSGISASPQPTIPYQRVEYLESSGSQCIDTGLYMNQDSKLVLEYQGFTNKYLLSGSRYSANAQGFVYANGGNSGSAFGDYFLQYGASRTPLSGYPNDEYWHTLVMTNDIYVDGNLIYSFNKITVGQFITPLTLTLFAMQSSTYRTLYGYMRIKSAKIYDGNDNLLLDAVAVRNGTTGEMYDQVSQSLLTRVGTFAYGNDIN